MRTLVCLLAAGALLCHSWALAAEKEPVTLDVVYKELQEVRRTISELRGRVERIERQLEVIEASQPVLGQQRLPPAVASPLAGHQRGPDRVALARIKLAYDPTKDQVRQYVSEILDVSSRQTVFSTMDPQLRLLTRVGPENVDVLLEYAGVGWGASHVIEALKRLATDDHKTMILDAFPYNHCLVEVIWRKRWEHDARKILIDELRTRPDFLPTEWIEAVASFQDPETYDDLKVYLVNGGNRHYTYEAIKDLPGIQLEEVVAKAWERAKRRGRWEPVNMGKAAIEFGHIDALECAINELGAPPWRSDRMRDAREVVLRHIEFRGTNEEIRRWFHANKDRLVFDPETKKFQVRAQ